MTFTVETPNGFHYYFLWRPGVRNSASRIAPGIDTRGAGGYVVAGDDLDLARRLQSAPIGPPMLVEKALRCREQALAPALRVGKRGGDRMDSVEPTIGVFGAVPRPP